MVRGGGRERPQQCVAYFVYSLLLSSQLVQSDYEPQHQLIAIAMAIAYNGLQRGRILLMVAAEEEIHRPCLL
jgi:hypothetical protein